MTKKSKPDKVRKYLWIVIFITNLFAILMLLGSAQAWEILPSKAPIFAYLGMGFPIFFVINIIYLIFWVFTLKWRFMLVQIVALLLSWTPARTYMPMNERSDNVPKESFKILSYNVRHFNWAAGKKGKENPIFDYILAQNADVMCFQEFGVANKTSSKGLISKSEIDKKFKKYPYREFVVLAGHKTANNYGLAIYSKFPIKKTKRMPIWSTYNGCVFHELNVNGRTLMVVNTHLESNRITSDDKKLYKDFLDSEKDVKLKEVTSNIKTKLSVAFTVREEQSQLISDYIKTVDSDGIIVCGDFNDTPISYTYNTMKGDLIDSYVATGRGLGITYHENMFLFRIDYIMHSISLKSYNTTVGEEKYSDHYPIWTNLMFK